MWKRIGRLHWAFWIYWFRAPSISRGIFSFNNYHPTVDLQSMLNICIIFYVELSCDFLLLLCCFFIKTCGRVMLNASDRATFLDSLKRPSIPYLQKKALRKRVLDKCKKQSICPFCNAINGTVVTRKCYCLLNR